MKNIFFAWIISTCMLSVSSWKLSNSRIKTNLNFKNFIKASTLSIGLFLNNPVVSYSFGPVEVPLKIISYKQVELCNGKKPIMPGQKAAEGLFPVCIEVEVETESPEKSKSLEDVSVYGFVKENDAGNSVLPNNPDFKSDAGQYAMINNVPPGKSKLNFQFVAALVGDPKTTPLPDLTFFKTKAVSYPGGKKFKALDVCEIDPRAEGCDESEDLD